jgi:hypothetical protein
LSDRAVTPGSQGIELDESIEMNYKSMILAPHNLLLPVIAASGTHSVNLKHSSD